MAENTKSFGIFNSNALKYIAALTMLIDHMGYLLFVNNPNYMTFRIIGRIAYPIFAFMIAEGCRYTKNKLKHFLMVFLLGLACQAVYFFYGGSLYMCILITFSLSIIIIYALQEFKRALFTPGRPWGAQILYGVIFLATVAFAYFFSKKFEIDYGFEGIMVPVFASALHGVGENTPKLLKKLDNRYVHIAAMSIALAFLARKSAPVQWYSFLSLPILLLYTGKRGKANTKYFFYIFYPAHLVALELISSYIL